MARRIRVLVVLATVLLGAFALAPVVLAGDPCYHGYTIPAPTSAQSTSVTLDPCAFLPTNAEVRAGATVTFTNTSEFPHLLVGANLQWGERDQELAPGASTSVTFDQPGVYAYACALHRGMSGAILVSDGDSAAAASTTATSGGDGTLTSAAVVALAALAVVGWGIVLFQRRRVPALVTTSP